MRLKCTLYNVDSMSILFGGLYIVLLLARKYNIHIRDITITGKVVLRIYLSLGPHGNDNLKHSKNMPR